MKSLLLIARLVVAVILLQTLYFKFTAHPDSVHIFSSIGMEPIGRIGVGVMELVASILILIPRTIWLGAGLSIGLMAGAIMIHMTQLGIEVNNDNGMLFGMASITFFLSVIILWSQRNKVSMMRKFLN